MINLRHLELSNCGRITNEMLVHLPNLFGLRQLKLRGNQVTYPGFANLKLPNCDLLDGLQMI